MSSTTKSKPSPWQCIVAGGAAGGLESLITYPTEYIKTRQQLLTNTTPKPSPLALLLTTLRTKSVRQIYTGATVFSASNASKSAVRFTTFDTVRNGLVRTDLPKPVQSMLAGLCAGVAESVTVLTPGENLKTKLIDSRATSTPPSTRQLIHTIVRDQGIRGLYRGIYAVTLKQSANAVVRFTAYQFLIDQIRSQTKKQPQLRRLDGAAPAVAGGAAGIVTVYATMPFDNLKTRLQALSAVREGTWACLGRIIREDGVRGLWKGTTPRLVRLTVAGMLSFSIYEQVIAWTNGVRTPEISVRVPGML